MGDRNYDNYWDRVRYAVRKLTAEAELAVPLVGKPWVKMHNTVCEKLDWAGDYVNQRTDDTRGPACDAVRDALTEAAELPSPVTPPVTGGATGRPR